MAQGIESSSPDSSKKVDSTHPKLSFRRYGTLSPDKGKMRRQQKWWLRHPLAEDDGLGIKRGRVITLKELYEAAGLAINSICFPFQSFDLFRTATMVGWAVAAYTPFFVTLYRVMDVLFPKNVTLFTVVGRASMSFLFSIPVNAAFFCYGSFVHHVTCWLALVQEKQQQTGRGILLNNELPFDLELLWSATRLKLEAELLKTVQVSASVWIPINLLNFSLVAAHMRPLVLMVCSTFWNCYLSLAQHRSEEL